MVTRTIILGSITAFLTLAMAGPAKASAGKIVVAGDEWAFSTPGLSGNPTYVNNVVSWFGLTAAGPGTKVMILDGQSWNGGFGGTNGAFGTAFRSLLTGNGVAVTYLDYHAVPPSLAGYDAVFADGYMTNAPTLTADLASFVNGGGAVCVERGTGTFPVANATGEASYWQPFFTAATGSSDFGLGTSGWFQEQGALNGSGLVGAGVTTLDWNQGQNVLVGSNPSASAAIWDSSNTLVASWSAPEPASLSLLALGGLALLRRRK